MADKIEITELEAENKSTGQKIIVRLTDDGVRFMKNIPFNPAILNQLRSSFEGKGVKIDFNKVTQWIRITKTEKLDPIFKEATDNSNVKMDVISPETILKKEAEMLNKAGFICNIRKI